jgi:two-component system OmpR family response regulator
MRILLLEDEQSAARLIGKGLREHGRAVDVIGDGASAIQQATAVPYDIVVLNILLPVKDGLQGARRCTVRRASRKAQ